jgi:heat shock protein HslJ
VVSNEELLLRPQKAISVHLRELRDSVLSSLSILALVGCGPTTPDLAGKEWVVTAVGDQVAPVGAGGRYLTMRFDGEGSRISGFSGCNQYNASYTLSGDSISFGPAISTKMACDGFDSLEQTFLGTIPALARWQASDSTLVLYGEAGVAIRLREGHN